MFKTILTSLQPNQVVSDGRKRSRVNINVKHSRVSSQNDIEKRYCLDNMAQNIVKRRITR